MFYQSKHWNCIYTRRVICLTNRHSLRNSTCTIELAPTYTVWFPMWTKKICLTHEYVRFLEIKLNFITNVEDVISMLLFMLISISTFPSEIVTRITNIKYLPGNINNATLNLILRSINLTWQNKLAIKLVTITTILSSISITWIG